MRSACDAPVTCAMARAWLEPLDDDCVSAVLAFANGLSAPAYGLLVALDVELDGAHLHDEEVVAAVALLDDRRALAVLDGLEAVEELLLLRGLRGGARAVFRGVGAPRDPAGRARQRLKSEFDVMAWRMSFLTASVLATTFFV